MVDPFRENSTTYQNVGALQTLSPPQPGAPAAGAADGKGGFQVDPIAVYRLIEFLMIIRTKMVMIDGKCRISLKK
jgi:hypothetical protein